MRECLKRAFIYELGGSLICQIKHERDGVLHVSLQTSWNKCDKEIMPLDYIGYCKTVSFICQLTSVLSCYKSWVST